MTKKSGITRKPLTYKNPENYYPMIVRTGTRNDFIQKEVLNFYAGRYGGEPLEGMGNRGMKKSGQVFGGVGPVSSGASIGVTVPQPYIPEFASPDRLFFPTDPREAMKYWRYFYALDPVCGNIIDMYSEMLMSDTELAGEGIDNEIKDLCYQALEDTNALSLFKWLVIGFMVDGEVIPHLIWNDDYSRWTYLGFQDPINVKVVDIPFADVKPYLEMIISEDVKKVLKDPNPMFEKFRANVPDEFMELIYQGRGIPLNTDENVTFIPRRLSAYDTRGISIFSRLWRVLILEDSVFNATIQTARRHSYPVKVVKLGDPNKNFIPGPEHERKLRELLAVAETDPHAWLLYPYFVNFEAWGTTDRGMTISKEWDIIERIKLIALGVSKAFIHGEVSYASAEKGLQVFLERLKGMRTFFENTWWYPRFFGVMAMKNDWVQPTEAEVSHRIKTRRSRVEILEDNRYIVPSMVWYKTLDSQKKDDLVRIYTEIAERFNIKISRSEVLATVGLDWEEQEKKYREENKEIEKMDKELGPAEKPEAMPEGAPGGMLGAPRGIGAPVMPSGEMGEIEAPEAGEGEIVEEETPVEVPE